MAQLLLTFFCRSLRSHLKDREIGPGRRIVAVGSLLETLALC